MQTYNQRYSRKNMSTTTGNAGQVLGQHVNELNKLHTNKEIEYFITSIILEMNEEGQRYIDFEFIRYIWTRTFTRNYQFLYNIYLAGFSNLKLSNVGGGKF